MPAMTAPGATEIHQSAEDRRLAARVRRLRQVLAALEECAGSGPPTGSIPPPLRLAISDFRLKLARGNDELRRARRRRPAPTPDGSR